jgi:uncharacterized repeat protein (TIGR01451 family)
MRGSRSGWLRVGVSVTLVLGCVVVAFASAASAATTHIISDGPLTDIGISTDLNCSVNHIGDAAGEWFGDTACGTFLASGGTLFGPENVPAGASAAPRTTWTSVSQSAVTGSGTAASPFQIVTVTAAGNSGLQLTETDSYVTGEESYRVDVTVMNSGATGATGVLYRGGDCFLQNSDFGFGIHDADTGAISCTTSLSPGSRIEQMLPVTDGSNYFEGFYDTLWAHIGSQNALPDTCDCTTFEDNSIGLSWNLDLAAGASRTFSSVVTLSPAGAVPLTLGKAADADTVAAGSTDGYTITVTNPNSTAVTLSSLTDELGAGFTYQAGTTIGATASDPSISGQTLTWGPITAPATGTATVHFNVTAPMTPGTYQDEAGGSASGFTVVGTGPTAPVTVTQASLQPTTLTVHDATGDFADATPVSAVLTTSDTAAPVGGASVTFTLDNAETCTGTTDSTGTASCSLTPGEAAGSYLLTASFAGDSTRAGSSGSANFEVTHEETSLTYTGATSAVNGEPVTLSGVLTTDDPASSTGLGNKLVSFALGTGASVQTCTDTTDSTGLASCTISSVNQAAGTVDVAASFDGDAFYAAATASSTISVFSPTVTGAFVVGDLSAGSPTAGKTVNFWGAQYSKNNRFSGGSAPSSMKGFANSPSAMTCGATWTTSPGNSSAPPATIPSRIDVIVSSGITKRGSVISGRIVHIVEVEVDPGYGPAPGHAGSGTITRTIC